MARPAAVPPDPAPDFARFYAGAVDGVYRALAVTLADAHLAREATDEAMARAFARWRTVATFSNPAGWVFRVGLNWATSWRRKLVRERPLADGGSWPVVDPAEADVATAALLRLPVAQRAVVVCRILFGLSTVETAVALDIPEGTVRSRLSRAFASLRAELSEEPPQ